MFSGNIRSCATLGIDINFKSAAIIKPILKSYNPIYQDMQKINILCMTEEEIFAEKVRAIMTRQKARDLFDLNFLINKGIFAKKDLIEQKLAYYGLSFDVDKLIIKIKSYEKYWGTELGGLISDLPIFISVQDNVIHLLRNKYGLR